jgi:hypothetical protein
MIVTVSALWAQFETATWTGVASDPAGGLIADASVSC